jgi:2-keto-4-pentenoate hydratase/2-oxohepta-3-ene-1,7-dioic acid hydratase in catechol pathway
LIVHRIDGDIVVTMKFIRYQDPSGSVQTAAAASGEDYRVIKGVLYGDYEVTAEVPRIAKLLAPVRPPAIVCIGLNYRHHAEETHAKIPEYPIVFLKMPSTLQDPNDPIVLPRALPSEEVDYEGELAVVIGKSCKNVKRQNALSYVLGYMCANDVSARDWQIKRGGSQWCRGKSFDTFAPMGPCLVGTDEISNPNALKLKTTVNGKAVQDWTTADMIFDVPTLIEYLSGSSTLLAGTVILTGTPQGVGMAAKPPRWLAPGDVVSVEIEKIGTLTNPVVAEVV